MKRRAMQAAAIAFMAAASAQAGTIHVEPGANGQERLQAALIDAKPGDIVEVGAGRFDLPDGLSLDVNGVTVTSITLGTASKYGIPLQWPIRPANRVARKVHRSRFTVWTTGEPASALSAGRWLI